MSTDLPLKPKRGPMYWAGWVFTILPVLALALSVVMKFTLPPEAIKGMEHLGWPLKVVPVLGVTEIVCTVLYLIPQTAVLGAILLTGYLGGAISAHVRVGDDFTPPVVIGIFVWLGLFLRDPRVRALVPWRSIK